LTLKNGITGIKKKLQLTVYKNYIAIFRVNRKGLVGFQNYKSVSIF